MAITKNSQIDLNGNEMILDADGDTTITADTDDQLDIKVGGSDKATFLANNLHLNGGTDARIQLGTGGAGANQVSNNTVHIRGDGTNMKLMTASGGEFLYEQNGTEHARINASGILTNPLKPYVLARRNGHLTSYNMANINGNTTAIYNYVESGQSNSTGTSAFSTTTGRFTAPVAGLYFITASAYANVSIEQFWLTDSSGNRTQWTDVTQGVVASSTAQVMTGSFQYYLAANESIGVHFYSSGDTAATIYDNNYHTYFRCVLIG